MSVANVLVPIKSETYLLKCIVGQSNGKMRTICILLALGATLITAHENDFEVVVKNDSPLARYVS